MAPYEVALFGGTLFALSFLHFIVDWGFQTHSEAMLKSKNHFVRARHCTVYTLGMAPLVYFCLPPLEVFLSALVLLWGSHFLIDTYLPVYLWAKHVRKMPVFDRSSPEAINLFNKRRLAEETDLDKFQAMARTPLGLFLMIAMDQAFHLAFLVPISALSTWPQAIFQWYSISGFMLVALLYMVGSGVRSINKRP